MNKLTDFELKNCSLIIGRGLFFYKKLGDENNLDIQKDRNKISDLAFYIRSLAEITVGMELWFKSIKNIQALGDAALIDQNHLFIKVAKLLKKQDKELSPFLKTILDESADKYYSVPYPDGKIEIAVHRKSDELLEDTQILTSKLLHQDEYSIIGSNFFIDHDTVLMNHLRKMALFWQMDFRNRIVITNDNFPEILKYYEENYLKIPFDYSKIRMMNDT